jgi:hypothetical protein
MSRITFRVSGNLKTKWMNWRRTARNIFALGLALCFLTFSTQANRAQEAMQGEWGIESDSNQASVKLTLHQQTGNNTFKGLSKVKLETLKGLGSEIVSAKDKPVRFQIVRDAGTFACEGYFNEGKGAGSFTFIPNQGFVSDMRALGYETLSQNLIFQMAARNVTLNFIQELRNLGYDHIPAVKLISLWLYNVTPEFVREMRSLGYEQLPLEELYALRVQSVTPQYVEELGNLGLKHPSVRQLIALRTHSVSPEFIQEIHSLGYENISADQLVSLRVFAITPAFIQKAKASGEGSNPSVDQLVKLKRRGSEK